MIKRELKCETFTSEQLLTTVAITRIIFLFHQLIGNGGY